MTSKNKQPRRQSLESFKATSAAVAKDQVRAITGGALSGCHTGGLA
jgi:hypothetical protein